MASLTAWLTQLGNAGAIRNAAAMCAERRAADMHAAAMVRRFRLEERFDERAAILHRSAVARSS